jgi:hypothetical protein
VTDETWQARAELFGGANGGGRCSFPDSGACCPPPSLTLALGSNFICSGALNQEMKPNALKCLTLAAAVIIAGTIVLLLATRRTAGRLLDGSRVVVQSASYGTGYSAPKPLLDRLFVPLPPIQRVLGYSLCSGPTGPVRGGRGDIFCFWLDFSTLDAAKETIGYAIADESGFEAPMVFNGYYGPYSPGGFARNHSGLVRGAALFPRHCKRFFLRLYQQDGSGKRVLVAQFPVKNLGVQRTPVWQAQPLPINQETNGLGLTLVSAEVGLPCPEPLVRPFDLQAGAWSEFRFRVTDKGHPDAGWTINEIWISDASGQCIRISGQDNGSFNRQFSRSEGEEIVCFHRWEYWSDEPAWKFRVHFEHPTKPGCWAEFLVRPNFGHRI